MKIRTIEISNYRKIKNARINMEDNITVLAGSNNSGKTSIIELLNIVFGKPKIRGKNAINTNDIPVFECDRWSFSAFKHFNDALRSNKTKDDTISSFCNIVSASPETMMMSLVTVKIQVDYNEKSDHIRNFADYIMELDPTNTSFYFMYCYELNLSSFRRYLDSEYDKIVARFKSQTDDPNQNQKIEWTIREMLVKIYKNSCFETAYFSDSTYTNKLSMELSAFRSLFNFGYITASRALDDECTDKSHILSKNMIDIASQEEDWHTLTQTLPDEIIRPIQNAKIQDKVRAASIDSLKNTMDDISKTNGGQAGNIVIDMDITEESIKNFLKTITCAKYQIGNYYLNESSQGLGYSNLIYIHLQLEQYKKTIDPLVVNFFVIEEPEAHMHPQMQNAFARYLFSYYKNEDTIQGMLTTHSHEVVRNALITQLRVLRQLGSFECKLYDLREFNDSIDSQELLEFYNWFYTINFPDLIFADKIIMYEGDTERMLIKSIIRASYKILNNQYISFVQVGGAYAHNYFPIVDFLEIKTVIITDLDYHISAKTQAEVLSSETTNSTIKYFSNKVLKVPNPKVAELYKWKVESAPIVYNNVCLAFQGEGDNYSRTLEEAMLSLHYGISVFDVKTRDEWKKYRANDKLIFSVPREDDINIKKIVLSTSSKKTDFMYSVIMTGRAESMLPNYIKEALSWLEK